jgi:hypothetical protein
MTSVLWALQILVALVFTITGTMKIAVPRERLAQKMHWADSWPRWRIKLLGAAELAGAAGLVFPVALGIVPMLTPIAAVCLALLMLGAIQTHQRLGEGFLPAAVVAALSVAIAVGRFYQFS